MTVKRLILAVQQRKEWATSNVYELTAKREFNLGLYTDVELQELDAELDKFLEAEKFYSDMLFEIDCILYKDKPL